MTQLDDLIKIYGIETIKNRVRGWFSVKFNDGRIKLGHSHPTCRLGDGKPKTDIPQFHGWNICNDCIKTALKITTCNNIYDILNKEV